MAVGDIGGPFTDKRRTQGQANKPGTIAGANYRDVGAMRTRLAAISGTTYTATVLNNMTANDMAYAIRVSDDAASI